MNDVAGLQRLIDRVTAVETSTFTRSDYSMCIKAGSYHVRSHPFMHSSCVSSSVDSMIESFGVVSSTLLDKIDRLFACNVGDSVALPQIVVVGDQSSGKSSVLEGLTGLPFPRDSGLCTRFATQITFRRSQNSHINVSIIPAKNSSLQEREKLQNWKKSGLESLDSQTFADIMKEVRVPNP
jgi:Dynamin family